MENKKLTLENLENSAIKNVALEVVKLYDVKDEVYGECPDCGHSGLKKDVHQHCWWCGQKLYWKPESIEDKIKNKIGLIEELEMTLESIHERIGEANEDLDELYEERRVSNV